MRMRARLGRLERASAPPAGYCPECPGGPLAWVEVDEAGRLQSGAYPPPCRRCGGPRADIHFIEVVRPAGAGGDRRDGAES